MQIVRMRREKREREREKKGEREKERRRKGVREEGWEGGREEKNIRI